VKRHTKPPTLGPLGSADATMIREVIELEQVRVVYQPVVDLRTRRIFAHEGLARSASEHFDGPISLFAAAVKAGATGELGRLLRRLTVEGCPDTPLFINIHPNELNEPYIIQPDDPIFAHGEDVFLEITESVPLSHFKLCQNMLHEVRGRGVHLVVDDLGAGYSNLKYIADLNPAVVKLDRGLIAGMTRESRMFTLVRAIVGLCSELGAKVVAEGIETPTEFEAVLASGAHYGQGYLLARPAFPPPSITWPRGHTRDLSREVASIRKKAPPSSSRR
jgi:EAL domain-containing protein (putative c-di-GMP-specific phosphodiesterase class I)